MIPDEPGRDRAGSIGFPIPNTECKLVEPGSGKEVGANETGELWIRGPQVMKGYLNNPDATKGTLDADGWLHTGDIGKVDDDGYFFIVDRLKELIKYKGFQVPPAELEAVLLSHPQVSDAAVIPVPDEEAGEIPRAYVVTKEDVSAEDIMSFVAEHVAPYKKVRQVEFVEEIPKSASGKILRRVLVERSRAGT
jgi:acyl-CoA synthetase (AMP-forming)/AMP-acid ligase II